MERRHTISKTCGHVPFIHCRNCEKKKLTIARVQEIMTFKPKATLLETLWLEAYGEDEFAEAPFIRHAWLLG